jgi:hypothetical protein
VTQRTRPCPRTEFDGLCLFVEHAVDGSRQLDEWLGDLGLAVFLDSVLEQPFSKRRCGLSTFVFHSGSFGCYKRHVVSVPVAETPYRC